MVIFDVHRSYHQNSESTPSLVIETQGRRTDDVTVEEKIKILSFFRSRAA